MPLLNIDSLAKNCKHKNVCQIFIDRSFTSWDGKIPEGTSSGYFCTDCKKDVELLKTKKE